MHMEWERVAGKIRMSDTGKQRRWHSDDGHKLHNPLPCFPQTQVFFLVYLFYMYLITEKLFNLLRIKLTSVNVKTTHKIIRVGRPWRGRLSLTVTDDASSGALAIKILINFLILEAWKERI